MIIISYIIVCIVFGTTFLAITLGVEAGAPPFMSAGLRFFLAGFILFFFMVLRRKAEISLLFRKEMILTGICMTFGTYATLYWGEQYVSSGIASVLSATGPMIMIVIQTFILGEKFRGKSLIGCLIGLGGVILLLSSSVTFEVSSLWMIGCFVILIGVISYNSGALYSKRVIGTFKETSPIALNAAQMMYGGGLLIFLSLFTEKLDVQSLLSMKAMGSLLYLIFIGSMVGHSLFYWLIAKTNPVFPSTALYITPLIAISIGAIFNNEPLTWLMGIGVITTIAGTVIVNFDSLKELILNSQSFINKRNKEKLSI
ncbi:EamA family transporter [Bacillus sp. FJAT-29790]|uniref:DMT family transporter n=1 Tax=Bacillus sp. FJAT-29790 TaxID=1895002 RepID=UPI001C2246C8|nr:EamA family transporter [Bacillus sp. FJAT-29790]MBU8878299.1 EamA family transporter [Bacillus sp. FJAT-29790]